MYFVNLQPTLKNPLIEIESFCALTRRLTGEEVGPVKTLQDDCTRFFFVPDADVDSDGKSAEIAIEMPGVTIPNVEVYIMNNALVIRGTAPLLENRPADANEESAEYYRAIRFDHVLLGDSLEVEEEESDRFVVRAQFDLTTESQPASRIQGVLEE